MNTSMLFSQDKAANIDIIYIEGLESTDYYTLLKAKKEVLKFEVVEACIPKGLLAIKYVEGYNEGELRSYVQSLISKKTEKTAIATTYTIDDLRKVCSSYREGLNK